MLDFVPLGPMFARQRGRSISDGTGMAEELRRDGVIEFPNVRLTAGGRLRAAREAAGLTLVDLAGETKIPVRMLTLIEAGDYAALPAKAYATGFSRTYARALGLDENEILAEVRRELGQVDHGETRLAPAFEPGDPARVPTARFAWAAAVAALAVLVAGLVLWRSYYAPAVTLPPLTEPPPPRAVAAPARAPVVVVPLAPASGAPVAAELATGAAPVAPVVAAAPKHSQAKSGAAAPGAAPAPAPSANPVAAAPAVPAPASTAQF